MPDTGSRPRSFTKRYDSTSGSPSACATSRFVGGTRSGGVLRDSSSLGESFRTDDRGQLAKASPEASHDVAVDEVYLKIDGRMVYLWRAVDAEGEVLDVLVQSKRNKHAALKLMRKLLKKYALVPDGWSPTTCDHIAQRFGILGSNGAMSAGDGTTEPRIRMSRRGGGNARCGGSRAPARRRSSLRPMLPSTTPSTSNAISLQPKRTACYA